MLSLAYNIGPGAFSGSSVLKRFNQGDMQGAADAFLMWNKGGGKVLKGLTRRREAERELFLS
jgi:lysozyme